MKQMDTQTLCFLAADVRRQAAVSQTPSTWHRQGKRQHHDDSCQGNPTVQHCGRLAEVQGCRGAAGKGASRSVCRQTAAKQLCRHNRRQALHQEAAVADGQGQIRLCSHCCDGSAVGASSVVDEPVTAQTQGCIGSGTWRQAQRAEGCTHWQFCTVRLPEVSTAPPAPPQATDAHA